MSGLESKNHTEGDEGDDTKKIAALKQIIGDLQQEVLGLEKLTAGNLGAVETSCKNTDKLLQSFTLPSHASRATKTTYSSKRISERRGIIQRNNSVIGGRNSGPQDNSPIIGSKR